MANPVLSLRQHVQLSQAAFGDSIGVSAARVCQVEKGIDTFGRSTIAQILRTYADQLKALELTALDFLKDAA